MFDTPLLSAVGHPVVVNPDPSMVVMATVRRWPIVNLDVSPGVVKIPVLGVELQKVALQFARTELMPYARFDISGIEHIPAAGPAIIVGNHRSYFDPGAMALVVARSGRTVRFLGKKEVFDVPLVGQLSRAMGGIRVDRASGSSEPLQAAVSAIEGGELVGIMPQGTIPRGPAFFDPVLKGRWGAARLAQLTKAPVIPVGLWGTERVWPRSSRLPNVLNVADPPLVTVSVGPPVELKHRSLDADTKRIMAAISAQLPAEARRAASPDARRAGRHLPARLPRRARRRARAATGHRLALARPQRGDGRGERLAVEAVDGGEVLDRLPAQLRGDVLGDAEEDRRDEGVVLGEAEQRGRRRARPGTGTSSSRRRAHASAPTAGCSSRTGRSTPRR